VQPADREALRLLLHAALQLPGARRPAACRDRGPQVRHDVCGACKFWQEGSDVATEMGECRRRPPTVQLWAIGRPFPDGKTNTVAAFPPTHATTWCGEFEADDAPEGDA
jgi:hypothetical protein